jgi:hypothetical protein
MKSIWLILIIIIGILIIVPNLRTSTTKNKPASGTTFEGRVKTGTKESYTPKEQHQTRVYLTMTTLPERVKTDWFRQNLVKNIAAASKNNFAIILNIPKISIKTGKPYFIPTNIKQLVSPFFIIHYTEKDEGPITKLLPTLRNPLVKSNDIIIVCDDDIVYKENVFEMIYLSVQKHPKSVSAMCNTKIEGFKTFGFTKKTLEPLLLMKIPKSCFRIDDDVIQFFIDTRRIPIVAVPYLSDTEWDCSIHFEESEDHPRWEELKNDDRTPMQATCLNELRQF